MPTIVWLAVGVAIYLAAAVALGKALNHNGKRYPVAPAQPAHRRYERAVR